MKKIKELIKSRLPGLRGSSRHSLSRNGSWGWGCLTPTRKTSKCLSRDGITIVIYLNLNHNVIVINYCKKEDSKQLKKTKFPCKLYPRTLSRAVDAWCGICRKRGVGVRRRKHRALSELKPSRLHRHFGYSGVFSLPLSGCVLLCPNLSQKQKYRAKNQNYPHCALCSQRREICEGEDFVYKVHA